MGWWNAEIVLGTIDINLLGHNIVGDLQHVVNWGRAENQFLYFF